MASGVRSWESLAVSGTESAARRAEAVSVTATASGPGTEPEPSEDPGPAHADIRRRIPTNPGRKKALIEGSCWFESTPDHQLSLETKASILIGCVGLKAVESFSEK
jgi:hypothetical protein